MPFSLEALNRWQLFVVASLPNGPQWLPPLVFPPLYGPLLHWIEMAMWQKDMREMTECDFWYYIIQTIEASGLLPLACITCSRRARHHVRRTHKQPSGQVHMVRDKGFCWQPASSHHPCEGATLETSSSCSQAFRRLQPHQRSWARNTRVSHSWIAETETVWDKWLLLF